MIRKCRTCGVMFAYKVVENDTKLHNNCDSCIKQMWKKQDEMERRAMIIKLIKKK